MRRFFIIAALLLAAVSPLKRAEAQTQVLDDPLRHGHALLIGNSNYKDPRWPQLEDIPLQLDALQGGLLQGHHFDTVEVEKDLETEQLRARLYNFLQKYGNDSDARLFIYYAGHGYTEPILVRNEYRGYITGTDTPALNGTSQAYDAARRNAIPMSAIRQPVEDALAKSILFVFDSCFAGTIFTDRAGNDTPQPLTPEVVAELMKKPARDFITAGRANQRVPAHSPIPELFLAAINGAADPYKHGVISSIDIYAYLLDRVLQIRNINLTPQEGRLPHPAFVEGTFLFRVPNPTMRAPDEGEFIRLYRANAGRGDVNAQINLAYLYATGGGGLSKDDREAARLYKLAADQGNAYAQTSLGLFYENGRGGLTKDDREAARLYKLAADQGYADGQAYLGDFYERGVGGLTKDDREAARLYKLAADHGNAYAQNKLGLFYENGRSGLIEDDREAARLYKLAADQGYTAGQTSLGLFYENGRGGLTKDDREAARLYKLAADQGYAYAQTKLGLFYENGRGGLTRDDREAARLYKLAANQGYADGQAYLGDFYERGVGGLTKDDREAARLYKLATDQGNAYAQNKLGLFYQNGRGGLTKDDREAARLYKLAADQGYVDGQANLGLFYENGRGGLTKDDREAARLYKLAADHGNAYAQNALKRLGH